MGFFRMRFSFVAFVLLPLIAHGQGLFESSVASSAPDSATQGSAKAIDFSGFVKGALFGGQDDQNSAAMQGVYGQASLKLSAKKEGIGSAFAEVRLTGGNVRGSEPPAAELREAWGSVTLWGTDLKVGRQIVVWGRADALNPTNNITPKDELALSSEVDDTRLGNELVQVKKKLGVATLQGIWIPCYRPDVLLLTGSVIPAGVTMADPRYPGLGAKNGGYAARLDINASSADGSLSYWNGYATLPGFDYALGASGLSLIPAAYRMQAIGGDISTAAGAYGLRAEAAYKLPVDNYENKVWIPHPYGQLVAGVDRSIGDWSVLLQYAGLYVYNFKKITDPAPPLSADPGLIQQYAAARMAAEFGQLNRLFTGTADEFSHSMTGNVQWNTMHETLHFKLTGLYNFTTEEYAAVPSVGWDVADGIGLTLGGRYINGKNGSLNKMVSNLMSCVYMEMKYSF
jgi:hypothetical protein